MRLALPGISLLIALFCGLLAPATAQDYEIKLVRASKVGDRYGMTANASQERHVTMVVNGQPAPPRDEVMSASLTAKVEVLALTPGGRQGKNSYTITKLTRTVGAQTDEVVPAGTVVTAERVGTKMEFMVGAAPVAPETAKVLALVIRLASDAGVDDDTVFGTKERKRIGDSWPIDSVAAAADAAARGGMKIEPANITGTVTLVDVKKDGLKVIAAMRMKEVGIPLPPGMAVTSSAFTANLSSILPVDVTKPPVSTSMAMDGKIECAGKSGDKDLTMVIVMKQVKDVTFTAP